MENINELLLITPIAAPLITMLMQVVKKLLGDKKKYIPLISLAVGIGVAFISNAGRGFNLNVYQIVVVGLLLGGTATGLYEAAKNLKPETI